jgi:oligosaccharide reducing-end xylanase
MLMSARSVRGLACVAALAGAVGACSATTDSLGYDDTESKTLLPLTPPASYPNPFRDLLGQTDAAISAKLNNAFNTIFHGSPAYAIYVNPAGTDQAYIIDTYHDNEIRTEGIGLGMMICVEFNKQDEFDKLWTYAREVVENKSGPDAGYFPSFCDATGGTATSCLDPYGFEQFVTALIFANDRWGSTGTIDYATDALALFHTLRHKEDDNGGVVDGVTNMFDAATNLPLDVPNVAAAGVTRPSLVMPGYYALWAEADADPLWTAAAERGRSFWQSDANATTGFMPVRAGLDGTPLAGWASFLSECYRAQINVVIDQIWSGGDAWNVTESNQLLAFFTGQGINTYGRTFSLDGTMVLDASHDPALVAANGIAALASTNTDRTSYVNAVWNMDFPTGDARYFSGLLQMVGLLILSGQFQVY